MDKCVMCKSVRNGQYLRYFLPRMNQEEIENMNTPITNTKIENLHKILEHKSLKMNATKYLEKIYPEIIPKIAEVRILPNSFQEPSYHPDTKTKGTKKEIIDRYQ